MLDSRPKGRRFKPHRRHCIVSLSKNINPSLVLVQPRKTRPFITERLLIGRKESNQTNKQTILVLKLIGFANFFVFAYSVCETLHIAYKRYKIKRKFTWGGGGGGGGGKYQKYSSCELKTSK